MFVVYGMIVSLVLEAVLVLVRLGKVARVVLSGLLLLLTSIGSSILIVFHPSIAAFLLLCFTLPRTINIARVVENRMQQLELRRRSLQTFLYTTLASFVLLGYIIFFDETFAFSINFLLQAQFVAAVALAGSVFVARTHYRYRPSKQVPQELPTVSICIPARNETQDLAACIESVLASTYPKLEILVLDDCSHDKTPEIIKGYAHAGVRFVNGKEPRDDWLAKNAAYDRLADEARGDILLFMGVDVRLKPDSIHQLVAQMNDNDMISILPRRAPHSEAAFFIQPIRYWWELGVWRFTRRNPSVLSTLWAIRADTLKKLGTLESVKKAVEPEAVLARRVAAEKKYTFLIANETVGVTSMKRPKDQYQTALRKRYPQLHRRPEMVLLIMLFELVFLLLPYIFFVWFLLQGLKTATLLSLITILLLSIANAQVYKLSLQRLWPFGFFSVPVQVFADWALLLRSMYLYEFNEVIWKERNICLPLLTVEKSLPILD
ncbi:glycosyltransferase [Candidatus Saccharibacteria bacterium]|nr:glycosyltransferase [Candidatus Saccharibacteria bacterium]